MLAQLRDEIRADISEFKDEIISDMEHNRNLTITQLKESITEIKKSHEDVKRTVTELDRDKRRKNVILFGIKDEFDNYWDLEKFVIALFNDKLQVNINPTDLDFIRRLGKNNGNNSRPILVGLVQFRTKLLLLQSSGNFRGTNMSISEDYPKEVLEIRKILRPKLVEARRDGKYAVIKYDKLIIRDNYNDGPKKKRVLANSPTLPPNKKTNNLKNSEGTENNGKSNLNKSSCSKAKLEQYAFTQRGKKELENSGKPGEEKNVGKRD